MFVKLFFPVSHLVTDIFNLQVPVRTLLITSAFFNVLLQVVPPPELLAQIVYYSMIQCFFTYIPLELQLLFITSKSFSIPRVPINTALYGSYAKLN